VHARTMELPRREAVIAGASGAFVAEDETGAVWEVRIAPERLAGLLAACAGGRPLEVTVAAGSYRALARRWWVLPVEGELLVRIALEKRAAA